jgi:hypothetical protein
MASGVGVKDLLIVVPTRSRPHNLRPVVEAWCATGGFDDAELLFVADADDPLLDEYLNAAQEASRETRERVTVQVAPTWQQLVPKLNTAVMLDVEMNPRRFAVGFAGDDHRPRTPGWAGTLLDVLRELGTGLAYPDDGYQHDRIPTSWAMSTDIVRALGAMVPAPVEHLFCDNAVRDLAATAGCLRYVPEVLVEHLHPVAGKADRDEQYDRVNSRRQWRADQQAYREWCTRTLPQQAEQVHRLVTGETTR